MTHNNQLTLCLIVKNEESTLPRCIDPLTDIADQIVIGDTGSRDRTTEIASQYTDDVFPVSFASGFGAARNAVLDRVMSQWVLFLDADEVFQRKDVGSLPWLLRAASPDVLGLRVLRYDFFSTGGWFSGRRLKLFRARPGIRYTGRINEEVGTSIRRLGGRVLDLPLVLNHFGHTSPVAVRHTKARQYLRLLEEQLADDPSDGVRLAYLAIHLRNLGRLEEALTQSAQALALAPHIGKVHIFRGHVLRSAGQFAQAQSAYRQALATDDVGDDYWSVGAIENLVGITSFLMGDIPAAQDALKRARDLDPLSVHVLINQGLLAEHAGAYSEAAALYREVANSNPAFLQIDLHSLREYDPVLPSLYETVPNFAGLARHLAYCEARVSGGLY